MIMKEKCQPKRGKAFVYNVKSLKCQMIMKEKCRKCAIMVFEEANITKLDFVESFDQC